MDARPANPVAADQAGGGRLMGIFDDPSYQKLKALRDSGYKGPVDQHGNKDTTSKLAKILIDASKKPK